MIVVTALVPPAESAPWAPTTLDHDLKLIIEAVLPNTFGNKDETVRIDIVEGRALGHLDVRLTITVDGANSNRYAGRDLDAHVAAFEMVLAKHIPGIKFDVILVLAAAITSGNPYRLNDLDGWSDDKLILPQKVTDQLWGKWADYAAGLHIAGLAGRIDQLD